MHLSLHDVVRAAAELGVEAAALLVGAVSGVKDVVATPELR
jgi:hypothetical protein